MTVGMHRRGALAALALGLATLLAVASPARPAMAQGALSCTAANLGQAVCQAQGICRCVLSEGGLMTGEPAGYQWRCDILYGNCSGGAGMPLLSAAVTPAAGQPGGEAGDPERVRAAQASLAKRGFNPGPVDGVVGPRTRAAVEAFQRDRSLPPTGALSPQTLAALGL